METISLTRLSKLLTKNKYVWLVLFLGLALLLLPKRASPQSDAAAAPPHSGQGTALAASGIPLDTESERLAALLREIRGVGEVRCLLSAEGAVVVCAGGDDPTARYSVTNAVSAYTGLGSDKISVIKMK